MNEITIILRLAADDDGYDALLQLPGRELEIGRVEPSADPLLPWRTALGQLAPTLEAAALYLAAARLEDETLNLRNGLL